MASPRLSKRVLTNKAVENARPRPDGRGYEQADAGLPSFFLNVQSSGHRSFVLRYRTGGRCRKWTIGSFPQLSLEQARKLAREGIGQLARGIDPGAMKAASRRPGALPIASQTIDGLTEEFLTRYVKKQCRPATQAAYERLLRKEVIPHWRGIDAAAIRRADVILLIEEIAADRPVLANRVLAIIAKLFSWAIERSLVENNPTAGVKKSKETARERALSDAELKLVLDAADALPNPVEKQFVHMLLLTLQRRSEVAGMMWSEIDLDARTWVIPSERSKNKRSHSVQLSSGAVAILEARPRDTDFVFPNSSKTAPFADFSRLKRELDRLIEEANGAPISQWGLHDLRRSGVSAMPRLDVDVVTADKILNHKSGTLKGVAAVYQRHTFEPEMKKALEAWASHLTALRTPNVLEFPRNRAQS
jgi:integrase